MPESSLRKPHDVARIFFQEILEGDRRKLEAQSNDAPTGGGARDLRVPHKPFGPIFRRMLPDEETQIRRRDNKKVPVTVYVGRLYWVEKGQERSWPAQYEPPTSARPTEGRIARIHEIPVLADQVPPADRGRTFLLLVQQDNGKVYPHYVTERDHLDDPQFNREIASAIRQCAANTSAGRSVRGYVDFIEDKVYCHG